MERMRRKEQLTRLWFSPALSSRECLDGSIIISFTRLPEESLVCCIMLGLLKHVRAHSRVFDSKRVHATVLYFILSHLISQRKSIDKCDRVLKAGVSTITVHNAAF